eukprot:m.308518 g.308518  ORF g.308518 m.308518 type:complete len:240 (+) comp44144_c0_seq1:143-862(+)
MAVVDGDIAAVETILTTSAVIPIQPTEKIRIEEGMEFGSLDELSETIRKWEQQNYVQLYRRDSRTIEAAKKRMTKRIFRDELGFSDIHYACVHGGRKFVSKSAGKRKRTNILKECPFSIKVSASVTGQTLVVRSVRDEHSHERSEDAYKCLPRQRGGKRIRRKKISNDLENGSSSEEDKERKYEEALQLTQETAKHLSAMPSGDFDVNMTILRELNDMFAKRKRILIAEIESSGMSGSA